jgi:hypothetical protein
MTDGPINCSLYPNANKLHEMHPDLRGRLSVDGSQLDIALWTRQTKDRTRIYHSATISAPYHKGETAIPPLAKGVKLYEFRKRKDTDPDFQTPEGGFELSGKTYHLALWVQVGTKEDIDDLKFTLALLTKPYAVELTSECQGTLGSLRERMRARAKELEEEKSYREKQAETAAAVTLNDDGEPDDLPF